MRVQRARFAAAPVDGTWGVAALATSRTCIAAAVLITLVACQTGSALLAPVVTRAQAAPPEPPAPAMRHLVHQRADDGARAFALCPPTGCEEPTPKTISLAPHAMRAPVRVEPTSAPLPLAPQAAMQPTLVQPVPVPPPLAAPAVVVQHARFGFELGKSTLSPDAQATLVALRPLLRRAHRIRITGYTDDLGAKALNDQLAQARAISALVRLREVVGEREALLSANGTGLCCYIVPNDSAAGRAHNRRAELEITLTGDPQTLELVASLASHLVPAPADESRPRAVATARPNAAAPPPAATQASRP